MCWCDGSSEGEWSHSECRARPDFHFYMTSNCRPGPGAGGATLRAGGGQKYLVVSEGAE